MSIVGVDPGLFRDRYSGGSTVEWLQAQPEVKAFAVDRERALAAEGTESPTVQVIKLAQFAVRNSLKYPLSAQDVGEEDTPQDPWTTGSTGTCAAFTIRTAALLEVCGVEDTRIAFCNGHYFNMVPESSAAALHMVHTDQPTLLNRFNLEKIPQGYGPFRADDINKTIAAGNEAVAVGMDVNVLKYSVTQDQSSRAIIYPWLDAKRPCPAATVFPAALGEVAIARYSEFLSSLRTAQHTIDDESILTLVDATEHLREANPQLETRSALNDDIGRLKKVLGRLATSLPPAEAEVYGTAIIDNYADAMPPTASMYRNRADMLRTLNNKGVRNARLSKRAAELYSYAAQKTGTRSQLIDDKIGASMREAQQYSS